jgi:thioredoxin reductase
VESKRRGHIERISSALVEVTHATFRRHKPFKEPADVDRDYSLAAAHEGHDCVIYARRILLETSRPGVFAVGDVRYGNIKRVASAVGEGSIAISFVHRVMAE